MSLFTSQILQESLYVGKQVTWKVEGSLKTEHSEIVLKSLNSPTNAH